MNWPLNWDIWPTQAFLAFLGYISSFFTPKRPKLKVVGAYTAWLLVTPGELRHNSFTKRREIVPALIQCSGVMCWIFTRKKLFKDHVGGISWFLDLHASPFLPKKIGNGDKLCRSHILGYMRSYPLKVGSFESPISVLSKRSLVIFDEMTPKLRYWAT